QVMCIAATTPRSGPAGIPSNPPVFDRGWRRAGASFRTTLPSGFQKRLQRIVRRDAGCVNRGGPDDCDSFRYKKAYVDGSKALDYGLIAEEVEEVFPDLVVKGADGQVHTVQYQKLTPMLLNEVQKQHQQLDQQAETIQLLQQRLAALEAVLSTKTPST